jgi:hypothetical protein
MGVILDSEDFIIDQVLDIIIIFVLGIFLLIFFNMMINYPRTFIITLSIYSSVLLILLTTFINNYGGEKEKHLNKLKVLNFVSIYTICLNIFIVIAVSSGFISI